VPFVSFLEIAPLVVADVRIGARSQASATVHQLADALFVGLAAGRALSLKLTHTVGEERGRCRKLWMMSV